MNIFLFGNRKIQLKSVGILVLCSFLFFAILLVDYYMTKNLKVTLTLVLQPISSTAQQASIQPPYFKAQEPICQQKGLHQLRFREQGWTCLMVSVES